MAAMVVKVSAVARNRMPDDRFVLVSDGSDLFGDGEDDMEIVCWKNFGRSLLDPRGTRE